PLPNDDRYYRATVEIVGPIGEAIDAIRSLCGSGEPKYRAAELRGWREQFRAFVSPERQELTAQHVLEALRAALPENAIATCDVGYDEAVPGPCWHACGPDRFVMS